MPGVNSNASVVRELKCKKCGWHYRQRSNEYGSFEKMEDCTKCGTKNSVIVLQTYMG